MFRSVPIRILALGTVILLMWGGAAHAVDKIVADGDGVAPVADNDLEFGEVCPGTSVTQEVILQIGQQNTNTSNNFSDDETVNVTVTDIHQDPAGTDDAGSLSAPAAAGSITIPSDWNTPRNTSKVTDTLTTIATIAVPVNALPEAYAGNIEYLATGQTSGTTRPTDLDVTWTVLDLNDPACSQAAGKAATAWANEWLKENPCNNGDFRGWRGELISQIARGYAGQGAAVNSANVLDDVEQWCDDGTFNNI